MSKTALVVGAAGAVGEACALQLRSKAWRVVGTLRRDRAGAAKRLSAADVELVSLDARDIDAFSALTIGIDALVFTPNLQLLILALPSIAAARIVAFSSNNVAIAPEAAVYGRLAAAESALRSARSDAIIIRPTMIYGDPRLETVTRLMRLAQRWPVLPLAGSGRALTQPVFYADLGVLAAGLATEAPGGGTFAAGGPDVLTLAAFYRQIAQAAGANSTPLPTPLWALRAATWLRLGLPLDSAQVERAESDRRAVEMDRPPPGLVPTTPLAVGLKALARALDVQSADI
jgi:NADH dehydrogenase